jgi:hypothetical protein
MSNRSHSLHRRESSLRRAARSYAARARDATLDLFELDGIPGFVSTRNRIHPRRSLSLSVRAEARVFGFQHPARALEHPQNPATTPLRTYR